MFSHIFFKSFLGICTALTNCVKLSASIPHSISGQKSCSSAPQCNIQGRCTGVLLSVARAQSAPACQEICQSLGNLCQWYTYNSANNGCYAFEDCASINECETCLSGEDNCKSEGSENVILTGGGLPFTNILHNNFDRSDYFEVFDPNSSENCSQLPEFPNGFYGAVATVDFDRPVICGGKQFDKISNDCFRLGQRVVQGNAVGKKAQFLLFCIRVGPIF